jgi:RimJ/RimL family protein N-acetyltransferase
MRGTRAHGKGAMPVLETERLILRPLELADFEAFAAMWADAEVVRFIGGVPFPREESWRRFLLRAGHWHHLGFGYFAILDRAGGFLGEAGFHDMKRGLTPSIDGTLEAGWSLVRPAWGRGLAREAVAGLVAWSERVHPGRRLTAMIEPAHAASIRVAEACGFRAFADTAYHGKAVRLFER